MTVKVNDRVWRELSAKLERLGLKDATVKVGVLASAGDHEGGFGMAELAAVHEFGSPANNIPTRSFLRAAFIEKKSEMNLLLGKLAKAVIVDKLEALKALDVLGLWGVATVKRQITGKDIPPPLKPATVARKGSSKPLVDTGQLVNSITHEVVK